MVKMFNILSNTVGACFDPKSVRVVFVVNKVAMVCTSSGKLEFSRKCAPNIHEKKIDGVKLNKF